MDIEKVDIPYSQFIRLCNTDDYGRCTCFTCEERYHWSKMQCGHYLDRRHKGTRFLPMNTHPQCNECNVGKRGNLIVYRMRLVELYGEDEVLNLESKKYSISCLKDVELKELYDLYSSEVKRLRKEKEL